MMPMVVIGTNPNIAEPELVVQILKSSSLQDLTIFVASLLLYTYKSG